MTSASLASAEGDAATLAPAAASGAVLSALRFQTVTWCPTSIRRSAMAAPIRPTPAMPMCMVASSRTVLRGPMT